MDLVCQCNINSSYRSDHSVPELSIIMNPLTKGKGTWRFSNSLLYEKNFLNLVNTIINEEKNQIYYPCIQHRTRQKFRLHFTDEDNVFLEVLFLTIKGENIKISSMKKNSKTPKKRTNT